MPSVLITGCSTGFGLEAAASLGRRGWQVFATMRNLDKRADLDARMRADATGPWELLPLDVTDQASVDACVKEVLAITGGTLDALVNNAGVSSGGAFEDVPDEEFVRTFDTNFYGVLRLTRAVLPIMREQRQGRIVVVSSNAAFLPSPGMSAYTASKWAIEGWAESVAFEVDSFGIDVVLVEPGSYKTAIWDTSARFKPEDSAYAAFAEPLERFVDAQVIKRGRDPREVGELIAKALTTSRPRFRYPAGPDAHMFHALHGLLPHKAVAVGMRRLLRLPGRTG